MVWVHPVPRELIVQTVTYGNEYGVPSFSNIFKPGWFSLGLDVLSEGAFNRTVAEERPDPGVLFRKGWQPSVAAMPQVLP